MESIKHFITVLGTGNYKPVAYSIENNQAELKEVKFVQEAIIDQIIGKINPNDKITILLTDKSEQENYNSTEKKPTKNDIKIEINNLTSAQKELLINLGLPKDLNSNLTISYITNNEKFKGLKETLIEKGIQENQINPVKIPVGANTQELMDIFSKIYQEISPNEEIYIDVTHSLRNIPIQLLSVLTFAEKLKNINIKGIYYGAFEVGNKEKNVAPIFNLMNFLNIIKWSFAANSFIKFGNIEEIYELVSNEKRKIFTSKEIVSEQEKLQLNNNSNLINALRIITNNIETARGFYKEGHPQVDSKESSIMTSYLIYKKIKNNIFSENKFETEKFTPIEELLSKIDDTVNIFDVKNNLELGIKAVEWAIKFNKIQQGYTALEETCKTLLCNIYGLDEDSQFSRESICKRICSSLYENFKDIKDEQKTRNHVSLQFKNSSKKEFDENPELLNKSLKIIEEIPFKFTTLLSNIGNCRNSINHFGYSNQGKFTSKNLINELKHYNEEFTKFVEELYTSKIK